VLSKPYNLAISENANIVIINVQTCLIEKHSLGLIYHDRLYIIHKAFSYKYFGNVDFRDASSAPTIYRSNLRLHSTPWTGLSVIIGLNGAAIRTHECNTM